MGFSIAAKIKEVCTRGSSEACRDTLQKMDAQIRYYCGRDKLISDLTDGCYEQVWSHPAAVQPPRVARSKYFCNPARPVAGGCVRTTQLNFGSLFAETTVNTVQKALELAKTYKIKEVRLELPLSQAPEEMPHIRKDDLFFRYPWGWLTPATLEVNNKPQQFEELIQVWDEDALARVQIPIRFHYTLRPLPGEGTDQYLLTLGEGTSVVDSDSIGHIIFEVSLRKRAGRYEVDQLEFILPSRRSRP